MRGGEKCASEGVPTCAGLRYIPLAVSVHASHPPQMHTAPGNEWCRSLRLSYMACRGAGSILVKLRPAGSFVRTVQGWLG